MKTKILLIVLVVGLFTIFMACKNVDPDSCEENPERCLVACVTNPEACFEIDANNLEMVTDSVVAVSKLPIRK